MPDEKPIDVDIGTGGRRRYVKIDALFFDDGVFVFDNRATHGLCDDDLLRSCCLFGTLNRIAIIIDLVGGKENGECKATESDDSQDDEGNLRQL